MAYTQLKVETSSVLMPTTVPAAKQWPISKSYPSVTPVRMPSPSGTAIRSLELWWGFRGSHRTEDKYYLYVVVLEEDIGFVPIAIEIIDPATQNAVGPFVLSDRLDSYICPHLAERGHVYWTEGIEASKLLPSFKDFITSEPQIFRVTIQRPKNTRDIIEITEIPGTCDSSSE